MRRLIIGLVMIVFIISSVLLFASCKPTTTEEVPEEVSEEATEEVIEEETTTEEEDISTEEQVTITITSWRTDDIGAMEKVNALFMESHPNITVKFEPIINKEYYAQLGTALETETMWADLIGLHAYDTGLKIYEGDYLYNLNDSIPELNDWDNSITDPWSKEGQIYAVPFAATSQGIYYNKGIFDKYGLEEPTVWSDFIGICDTLKENGETVFAQGAIDGWTISIVGFGTYGPNFYGGDPARKKLLTGELALTDDQFIRAFEVTDSLTKYYPDGFESIDYVNAKQLFVIGDAAMFLGGSWEIFPFRDTGLDFELSWFPAPVENEGDRLQYAWNPDIGLGLYKNSPNMDAALEYLKWTTTEEFGQALMSELPGFFSYVPGDYELESIVLEMLAARDDADLTVRLFAEKISAQEPTTDALMREIFPKLALKEVTPDEAAKYINDNVATWYEPWQK